MDYARVCQAESCPLRPPTGSRRQLLTASTATITVASFAPHPPGRVTSNGDRDAVTAWSFQLGIDDFAALHRD